MPDLQDDLLDQAEFLLSRDERRPKQANLRRAVSAAYYALFHQLAADTTFNHLSSRPRLLQEYARRSLGHHEMKAAAKA